MVAVSGGVDSVVLLDLLSKQPDLELIVSHYDHGIRADSSEDRQLVATLSHKYGLKYEFTEGKLGAKASESQAREARYEYLRQVCKKHRATGVITAHHKDDALETMAFNLLRGTRRKGVNSLKSRQGILRPLLPYSKQEIRDYAVQHNLQWREDSTNKNEKYSRNWIRRKLLPKLTPRQKDALTSSYAAAVDRNYELDTALQQQLKSLENGEGLDRRKFIALPYSVACEVMADWLRQNRLEFDRKLIDRLVVSVKTLLPGKKVSVSKHVDLAIGAGAIKLQ